MGLEIELATYRAHLMELLSNEGKYVVIKGEEIAGCYGTYDEALEAGYLAFGPDPFLVKKIQKVEPIHYFTRELR